MADFFYISAGVAAWMVSAAALTIIVVIFRGMSAAKRAAEDIREKGETLKKLRYTAAISGLEWLERIIRGSRGGDKKSE